MTKRKYGKVGNATPNQDFVTGNNSALNYIIVAMVFVIILYTVANWSSLTAGILKNEAERKKRNNTPTEPETPSNPVTPSNNSGSKEPAHLTQTHELQWLLNKAGYDTGGIDGQFGSKSNTAMRAFEDANSITRRFVTSNYSDPIAVAAIKVREILKREGKI